MATPTERDILPGVFLKDPCLQKRRTRGVAPDDLGELPSPCRNLAPMMREDYEDLFELVFRLRDPEVPVHPRSTFGEALIVGILENT